MIDSIEKIHHHTSEEKLKWFGYGEWVKEPDEVLFEHVGLKCRILRVVKGRIGQVFGGHLCGYVSIPEDHLWFGKHYDEIDVYVHYGLTYGGHEEDGLFWVGFDCAHLRDLVPSIEKFHNTQEILEEFRKIFPEHHPGFDDIYRNMDFCIEQCKSMAEQIKNKAIQKTCQL